VETTALRKQPESLGDNKKAGLVVEGASCRAVAHEGAEFLFKRDRVAKADDPLGLLTGGRADIDPKVLQLRPGVLLGGREQVKGRAAHDPRHNLAPMHPHALADGHDVVMPADRAEMQKAVFRDVVDDETDLIHVRRQHDAYRSVRIDDRERVAVDVGPDLVDERARVAPINLCSRLLVAAWRWCVNKLLQKVEGFSPHASQLSSLVTRANATRRPALQSGGAQIAPRPPC
jgi:hypothetical protein